MEQEDLDRSGLTEDQLPTEVEVKEYIQFVKDFGETGSLLECELRKEKRKILENS